jgi:hypothetical protein
MQGYSKLQQYLSHPLVIACTMDSLGVCESMPWLCSIRGDNTFLQLGHSDLCFLAINRQSS